MVVVCDRRPSMALYDASLPWLSKPAAVAAVVDAIVVSALVARGDVGYVDTLAGARHGEPLLAAAARRAARAGRSRSAPPRRGFDAPADTLERALHAPAPASARALPAGSFVFVVSDFLGALPAAARAPTTAPRWDVVPVVVQDPVWEQSFPELPGRRRPVRRRGDGQRSSRRGCAAARRASAGWRTRPAARAARRARAGSASSPC